MKTAIRLMAVAAGLLAAQVAMAQAPAGATGQCKDGTYSTAASKQGACRGHQGVKEWYAATAPAAAPAPAAAAAAPKSAAAAAPAAAPKPANATGLCNDGTYATSTSKSAGCRGHQGVKEWYAAATPAAPTAAAKTAPAPMPATAPAASAAAPAASTKASPASKAASMTQAAGGGPGLVWVNTDSNVYHCYGTTYYGKTKQGSYMSEADAKTKGAHADHGHACSK
ncbi:MAG TPA: DUF3761 domain-containing protein [Edaphobacter sp.]|nr:DUF3761 domain-containing protein [Edaphobacter sp.]